jgi:AraC-like DNA-binding protein
MLKVGTDVRVLPFHLLRQGSFDLHHGGHAPVRIDMDEVAICPGGIPHRMSSGAGAVPCSLADILAPRVSFPGREAAAGTELVCGFFLLRAAPLNPLLAALPAVLKVKTAGSANPLLVRAAEMLCLELAEGSRGSFTASRLLEVFCAEAIKAYRRSEGAARLGWFNALNDQKIGRAIARVHERPGGAWTVALIAETVAIPSSRFAARLREVMGQSAIAYVASWRMNVACRLLRETERDLAGIAPETGYQDVAAFSRAFKGLTGESPARWRSGRSAHKSRRYQRRLG